MFWPRTLCCGGVSPVPGMPCLAGVEKVAVTTGSRGEIEEVLPRLRQPGRLSLTSIRDGAAENNHHSLLFDLNHKITAGNI